MPRTTPSSPSIARHKTAMHRASLSRPVSLALADGVLCPKDSVFDYGCGHGTDIALLRASGYEATGWDPHFAPEVFKKEADVVNLGYILNVIERPEERQQALREAFSLARKALIVAVRVDKSPIEGGEEYRDGVLTSRGGFQKFFTQKELRDHIETVLGQKPEFASIGIAYVFRDEEAHQAYLANRFLGQKVEYHKDISELFAKDQLAQEYLKGCRQRGRPLRPREFRA